MRILAAAVLSAVIPAAGLAQTATPAPGAAAATTVPRRADAPPANGMTLSAVLSALEASVGDRLSYVDEADWDDDGYWEVKYYTTAGEEVEVKLDPMTGQPRG